MRRAVAITRQVLGSRARNSGAGFCTSSARKHKSTDGSCIAMCCSFCRLRRCCTRRVQRESSRSTVLHSFLLSDLACVKVFFFPTRIQGLLHRAFKVFLLAFRIPPDVRMHLKVHQTRKSAHSAALHGKSVQFTF